jgi:phosphoribosylformylglycinamidine synthase
MVYRCFSVKKPGYDVEAQGVLKDLKENLGVRQIRALQIVNRYDVEGIELEIYEAAKRTVFSEPQCDVCFDETLPEQGEDTWVLAVEALPGQYDQRADSCAQCIQVLTCLDRPAVAYAKLYVLSGTLSSRDKDRISDYLINPVDSRAASLDNPLTLVQRFKDVLPVSEGSGFIEADSEGLGRILQEYALAMDLDDILFMQNYYKTEEKRNPTVTELRVVDTYWSDHCRHTTFGTQIEKVQIRDPRVQKAFDLYRSLRKEVYGEGEHNRPVTLMDVATIGAKTLKKRGFLKELDESEEVNACSIHVEASVGGRTEDWLLLFKNETHNHPTEIEPFGGAATCIGGAIRDPLSGRSYVYQAMRVTGSGDPRAPVSKTIPGKLPQRKLTTTAAAGYSSYGNQIGLATGLVTEIYHPGYIAKRMEVGAVVGAVRAENVVRETPAPGDVILLVGGRTGRDGCGGATGSSKTHDLSSLTECAAEVQKGNAPEERKMQRLFRNPQVSRMIKRCNDFGAGGVSVAIGELADGVFVELDQIKKKYEGLDGTELAISESQERMAVVVAPENSTRFIELAELENLEATPVARVTGQARMEMTLNGKTIVSLSRAFLASNGAVKYAEAAIEAPKPPKNYRRFASAAEYLRQVLPDLNFCSQRGLGERFDGSIGAGSVLMPYGGATQKAPAQVMAALLPAPEGNAETCSVMSFAFDPYLSQLDPFRAAKDAVIGSVAKLVAAGCDYRSAYLTFQEYFEKLRKEPARWGKPLAALLGALDAQIGLGVAAIGGKDSMSGSFMELDVPPTLISFAIAPNAAAKVLSPELKAPGSYIYLFSPEEGYDGLKSCWEQVHDLMQSGVVRSARAVETGGVIGGIFKMAVGNQIGFMSENDALLQEAPTGSILCECTSPVLNAALLGHTIQEKELRISGQTLSLENLTEIWEAPLENVFPKTTEHTGAVPAFCTEKKKTGPSVVKKAVPGAVIPVFPGTNCEYDTALAIERAGGRAEIIVLRNLTAGLLNESVEALASAIVRNQMNVLPGGFSSGDEPEGSGKFIAAFFRNPRLKDAVHELLKNRDGLMLGICNGFQALIKLGLLPFGVIGDLDENDPTLTFNAIGRHQSRYVTTRVVSVNSPWLSLCSPGELHTVPVSHGEGRFVASRHILEEMAAHGQLATQYTNEQGSPSMDVTVNPNGSCYAVEGILSPDGRVFGKMAHTERRGRHVAINIPGNLHQPIFEGGVGYYK